MYPPGGCLEGWCFVESTENRPCRFRSPAPLGLPLAALLRISAFGQCFRPAPPGEEGNARAFLWLMDAFALGSLEMAVRRDLAKLLNAASMMWCALEPASRRMCRLMPAFAATALKTPRSARNRRLRQHPWQSAIVV